jgi:hypothetical protein
MRWLMPFLLTKEDASLVELVNQVGKTKKDFQADTNWLLLQVKQDLEKKGFIKPRLRIRKR